MYGRRKHGGLSTGPKTPESKARAFVHPNYFQKTAQR
jgi:hypothetical protein